MKASVFIATSLDGFIARTDGDIDWLGEPQDDEEDHGYQAFIDTVDYLVMGRNTYEKVLSFGVPWPYEKPVVVLTHRPLEIADELASSVESMSGEPTDIVANLSGRGAQHLYVDGGKTIQSFLEAGLIQRLIITRIPVLLGAGIPLFGPLQKDIKLRHVATRTLADGNLQSEYEVPPGPASHSVSPMKQYLGLTAIVVRDYDDAIEFYTNTLGFDLVEDTALPKEQKRWVVVAPPGARESRLLLARAIDQKQISRIGDQTGGRVSLFLYTDDFWRDYRAYRERGVVFVSEPKRAKYGTVAVFRDLYGNLWDLLEPST